MEHARRLLWTALTVALIAGCGKGSTGPTKFPGRAEMNGVYQCYGANAYYVGPKGVRRWRTGSCGDYIAVVAPSRADSIDIVTFAVNAYNVISRLDFFPGTFVYDSTTGQAQAIYGDRPTAYYQATGNTLQQSSQPIGIGSDGQMDSVQISFLRVN